MITISPRQHKVGHLEILAKLKGFRAVEFTPIALCILSSLISKAFQGQPGIFRNLICENSPQKTIAQMLPELKLEVSKGPAATR